MLARLRSSLTYANVVSTLCLVLVVGGGGAYAKSKLINGTELKPRSVTAAKIKKHSLTNTEVDIKKLGRVADAARLGGKLPSAFAPAGNYLAAGGTAANANALGGQPPSAFLAAGGTAANANALGGQPPSAYLPASRVMGGSATTNAVPAQVVLTYPPIGMTLKTTGSASTSGTTRVVFAAGTVTLDISHRGGIQVVRPGTEWTASPATFSAVDSFTVRAADQPTVGLTIQCGYDTTPYIVSCTGVTFN
ncbi:MAG: hypothetical protein JWQ48_1312 [Conexibacter sp.]|nr:hypothetical protein [Conexibacter sp.]